MYVCVCVCVNYQFEDNEVAEARNANGAEEEHL
jgi:hypothetical protein